MDERSREVTFGPVADTYVEEAEPDANRGTDDGLLVDESPAMESYLRFEVRGVGDSVDRATLRVYAYDGSTEGPAVYETNGDWVETEITWRTRPSRSNEALAETGPVAAESWVEYDVTTLVTNDGSYSFAIVPTSRDGVDFYAREGERPPELVVVVDPTNGSPTATTSTATTTPPPMVTPGGGARGGEAVLLAAGDISSCSSSGDSYTANLLDGLSGTVLTLGDNAYDAGTTSEFANCYDPTWGRHKARTRPTAGNHDYKTADASGYFTYFGAAAGDPSRGYYSYDLAGWHLVALNSNISMAAGSAQEQWLRADLAANPAACTLAYWHHPRYSSGSVHGSNPASQPLWQALYDYGAEVVLTGHEHHYERFAPLNAAGQRDTAQGLRSFVVGTGGNTIYSFGAALSSSEVRSNAARGVLKLVLRADGYDWQFVPEAGKTFTDTGSGSCHGVPSATTTDGAVAQDVSPWIGAARRAKGPTVSLAIRSALARRRVLQHAEMADHHRQDAQKRAPPSSRSV